MYSLLPPLSAIRDAEWAQVSTLPFARANDEIFRIMGDTWRGLIKPWDAVGVPGLP
jgi:hypothetical protein